MKSIVRTIGLFALATTVSSCATTHYSIRDTSGGRSGETVYYENGLKFRVRQFADRKLALAYDRMVENEPAFKLTLTNSSKTNLDFDPASVRCRLEREDKPAIVVAATDPESRLLTLQKQRDDLRMSGAEATASILNSTSGLLAVAANDRAAMAESDRRAEAEATQSQKRELDRNALDREMEDWRTRMVRRTTLKPGASVTGDLVCPTGYEDYGRIVVFLPVGAEAAADFAFERYALD